MYPTLTLDNVYLAIGYYLRHRDTVDTYIRRMDEEAERLRREWEAAHPQKRNSVTEAFSYTTAATQKRRTQVSIPFCFLRRGNRSAELSSLGSNILWTMLRSQPIGYLQTFDGSTLKQVHLFALDGRDNNLGRESELAHRFAMQIAESGGSQCLRQQNAATATEPPRVKVVQCLPEMLIEMSSLGHID